MNAVSEDELERRRITEHPPATRVGQGRLVRETEAGNEDAERGLYHTQQKGQVVREAIATWQADLLAAGCVLLPHCVRHEGRQQRDQRHGADDQVQAQQKPERYLGERQLFPHLQTIASKNSESSTARRR
ncbi:hypothetical protein PybrP1_003406 [[Pythium] brassicae (nom. inval.)]|nr:hypothetical protein PybrP1_003406 [[Pythium] brassicae (nom. inval.)]